MIQLNDLSGNQLHQLGEIIMGYQPFRDGFTNVLIGRIVWTRVSSAEWTNKLAVFKKGVLEMGEQIEDVFVDLAKPFDFNQDLAEKNVFKREFPNVRVTFYTLNYEKMYKTTVEDVALRSAFLSMGQMDNFIETTIRVLYTSMEQDEFCATVYMLGRSILNGGIRGVKVTDFTSNSNLGDLIATLKGTANYMGLLSRDYNRAGVYNVAETSDMYVLIDGMLDARVDVNVLANAFNMEKTEFIGRKITLGPWDKLDWERLDALFGQNPDYAHFTEQELAVLNSVGAVFVHRDFFQIYDRLTNMESIRNPEGRYWNYTLLTQKLYATSPFVNAVVFTKDNFSITDVDVQLDGTTVTTATCKKGRIVEFTADVSGTGVYNGAVLWTVSGAQESGTYMNGGTLRVASNETATTLTVTATSIADPDVSGTCTVTVTA